MKFTDMLAPVSLLVRGSSSLGSITLNKLMSIKVLLFHTKVLAFDPEGPDQLQGS